MSPSLLTLLTLPLTTFSSQFFPSLGFSITISPSLLLPSQFALTFSLPFPLIDFSFHNPFFTTLSPHLCPSLPSLLSFPITAFLCHSISKNRTTIWPSNPTQWSPMKYYSAIEKNEIMSFVAIRMDVKIITLSEASQTEKHKYYMTSLIHGI